MKKDRDFVDTNDMNELRYWAKKFKVSIAELLTLIKEMGNKTAVLKKYFER